MTTRAAPRTCASAIGCRRPGGLALTERLVATAALAPDAVVLDVGCGAGATVAHLADVHGLRAKGLDASPEQVAESRTARPDLDFVCGRAEALPFPDAAFDAVLCECVLSTLPAPALAVAEAARVLRIGGKALLSDVYVRAGSEAATCSKPAALGRKEAVDALLAAAGLRITWWEDASGALARYLWDRAEGNGHVSAPPPERRAPRAASHRPGYFACVAQLVTPAKGARDG